MHSRLCNERPRPIHYNQLHWTQKLIHLLYVLYYWTTFVTRNEHVPSRRFSLQFYKWLSKVMCAANGNHTYIHGAFGALSDACKWTQTAAAQRREKKTSILLSNNVNAADWPRCSGWVKIALLPWHRNYGAAAPATATYIDNNNNDNIAFAHSRYNHKM